MKIQRKHYKPAALLLSLILMLNCFVISALAYTRIDTEKAVSLTIQYPCAGASVRLYQVADVSAVKEYTWYTDFSKYAVSLEKKDQSGWRTLAATLAGYAARDQLTPTREGKTDTQGKLAFSGLKAGLYLVVIDKYKSGEFYYSAEPFLISLPNLDTSDNWIYDVSVSPKYQKTPVSRPGSDLKVFKVWNDNNNSKRPDQITVQLLRNGVVWDSVVLSKENNWRYTWKNLDSGYTWQVVEKTVPTGYNVTVQTDGNTVTITNTTSKTPNKPSSPTLPQTGVLWWPVGILATAGIILVTIGCIRRKDEDA